MQFANRWQSVKILFQGSGSSITTDFRMWMADEYISKRENRRRFSTTINRLLHKSSQNMQGDYEEDQV